MKFLVSLVGASGLLAALVAAAPLEKRVYVYTTETIVETVDVTVTVTATGPPPTTSAEVTTTPAPPATTSEAVRNKAQDVRPTPDAYTPPTPPVETTTSSTTSLAAAAPTTTSTTSSTPSPPPPAPTTTSTSTPPPPPSTTSTSTPPAYTPPASSTTSTAPAPVATNSNTVSDGGACSASQPCEGELTHYDTLYDQRAYGACGQHHDGRKEHVVALSHLLMGQQSNGNPVCGKYISITYKGVTERALVVDKCMGCAHNNVDLSESLFQKFAPLGDGRLKGARWHFTS